MVHPVLKMLAMQPELLADHLGAYGELAAAEAADAAAHLRARALLVLALALLVTLALGLGGTALMLLAALPREQMPAPWLLALVPALPLAGAFACWAALKRQPPGTAFPHLREQIAADAALLREAGAR